MSESLYSLTLFPVRAKLLYVGTFTRSIIEGFSLINEKVNLVLGNLHQQQLRLQADCQRQILISEKWKFCALLTNLPKAFTFSPISFKLRNWKHMY